MVVFSSHISQGKKPQFFGYNKKNFDSHLFFPRSELEKKILKALKKHGNVLDLFL